MTSMFGKRPDDKNKVKVRPHLNHISVGEMFTHVAKYIN